jgi:DNA-binding response OmpR family regulator
MAVRILIAERNPLVRESLQDLLRIGDDYTVSAVADARALADALATVPRFDFALIDCSLSGGHAPALAAQAANANTPFLLMTTDYRDPRRFPWLAARFITKPFAAGELLARALSAIETTRRLRAEMAVLQAAIDRERDALAAALRGLQEQRETAARRSSGGRPQSDRDR